MSLLQCPLNPCYRRPILVWILSLWYFAIYFGLHLLDFPSTAMSETLAVVVYFKALLASLVIVTPTALAFLGYLVLSVILILDLVAGTALEMLCQHI